MDEDRKSPSLISFFFALLTCTATATDYEKLAAEFVNLGLPDVAGGQYVRGHWDGYESIDLDDPNRLRGDMWVIQRRSDGTARIVKDRVCDEEVIKPEIKRKANDLTARQFAAGQEPDPDQMRLSNMPAYAFEPVDLARDLKVAITRMQRRIDSQEYHGLDHVAVDCFLFGLQAIRVGAVKEGSVLLDKVNQNAGLLAMTQHLKNYFANREYHAVAQEFLRSGDWRAFNHGIERVRTRFRGYWKADSAAKRLGESIRRRLALDQPPPVVSPGLAEYDHRLASALAHSKPFPVERWPSHWVLGSFGNDPPYLPTYVPIDATNVINRIISRRRESIPLLLALARDEHLVATWEFARSTAERAGSNLGWRETVTDNQPLTRGQVAISLLRPIIEEDNYERLSDSEVIARTRKWYLEHKNKTDTELLSYYLDSKHPILHDAAFRLLLQSTNQLRQNIVQSHLDRLPIEPNAFRKIESIDFETRPELEISARRFLARAETKLKGSQAIELLSSLRSLRQKLSDDTIEDHLKEYRAGKMPLQQLLTRISSLDHKLAPSQRAELYLELANESGDPIRILEILERLSWHGNLNSISPHWKTLLEKECGNPFRFSSDFIFGEMLDGKFPTPSFAHQVAFYLERACRNPEYYFQAQDPVIHLGKLGADRILNRARARIAGKSPLPEIPDYTKVSKERMTELQDRLATIGSHGLSDFIDSLELNDLMVLPEALKDSLPRPELTAVANRLNSVAGRMDSPKIQQLLSSYRGRAIDADFMRRLLTLSRESALNGQSGIIRIMRTKPFDGIAIETSSSEFSSKHGFVGGKHLATKQILTRLHGSGPIGEIDARPRILIGETKTSVLASSESEARAMFHRTVERLLDPRANCAAPMHIRLLIIDWDRFK